jgi:alkanesulfonate monooxygenase SsuD/methylene tetrahydromethanopterin reductase-like flavin-dependent oxidoreductase (luciferase family)
MTIEENMLAYPGAIGLSLPNRGVLFGAISFEDILWMSETAEASGLFGSVWVGDSILALPRLESLTTLAAIAARTSRVTLGTACLASMPLRHPIQLAHQWASLDVISGGRMLLGACMGTSPSVSAPHRLEYEAFGYDGRSRPRRMEEGIDALRALWTSEHASYEGKYVRFNDVNLRPKPVQEPCPPIWIASNPFSFGSTEGVASRALQRVAEMGDGWLMDVVDPAVFAGQLAIVEEHRRAGGRADRLPSAVHHMVNIQDDRDAAYEEAGKFLKTYYHFDFIDQWMTKWVTAGSPEVCAERIQTYFDAGVTTMILRFATWDQRHQLERCIAELLPKLRLPGAGA